ncbi:MAG: PilZ domain-containing protein [Polyangiaceae bacterium]
MSDPVSAARAARENLARGLGALQMPGVPPQLMSVAEPVAHAMSALHRIEVSGGAAVAEAGPAALNAARAALATLQASAGQHPAVDQALEAIAGSLSLIHGLAQPAAAVPAASGFGGTMVASPPQQAYPPQPVRQTVGPATQPSQAMAYQPRPEAPPQVSYAQPPAAARAYQQQPPAFPPAAPAPYQPPAAPAPYQPPAAPAYQAPVAAAYAAPPAAPPGAVRVEAELGAHSGTNFYKGLSGNDVIDSGGIFVATYQIPDIGQQLSLRVSMPGGYEFEALGVVRWTREAPNSGSEGSPGFGAQFTQITPEGRQLVYRYVRNREPLFHDDL